MRDEEKGEGREERWEAGREGGREGRREDAVRALAVCASASATAMALANLVTTSLLCFLSLLMCAVLGRYFG